MDQMICKKLQEGLMLICEAIKETQDREELIEVNNKLSSSLLSAVLIKDAELDKRDMWQTAPWNCECTFIHKREQEMTEGLKQSPYIAGIFRGEIAKICLVGLNNKQTNENRKGEQYDV